MRNVVSLTKIFDYKSFDLIKINVRMFSVAEG